MSQLTIRSWKKGLQTVSLIEAIRQYSTGSLIRAKTEVERLLAGEVITLEFSSDELKHEFMRKAEACGAVFE